jgi:hypothetical protein
MTPIGHPANRRGILPGAVANENKLAFFCYLRYLSRLWHSTVDGALPYQSTMGEEFKWLNNLKN